MSFEADSFSEDAFMVGEEQEETEPLETTPCQLKPWTEGKPTYPKQIEADDFTSHFF